MTRFQSSLLRIGIASLLGFATVMGLDAKQAYDQQLSLSRSACHHEDIELTAPSFREELRIVGNQPLQLDYDFILERPNALLTDPSGSN